MAFNALSCFGWAYVWWITVNAYLEDLSPADLWDRVALPLKITQTAAVLEVLHALFGVVRSPVVTVAMQVASRIVLLWGYTAWVPLSQQHWSLYMMVGSWATVEVPRYLFYFLNFVQKPVAYPVFWIRYSLFAFLYPSGVSGEMLQVFTALPYLKTAAPALRIFSYVLFVIYLGGAPFMYFNMVGIRKKTFKRRLQGGLPKKVPTGLMFPITDPKKDARSTTKTNQAAWVASIEAISADAARRVAAERNWRFGYNKHVVEHVALCLKSPQTALQVAKAGLAFVETAFEFHRDGQVCTLDQAMSKFKDSYETATVRGTKRKPKAGVELEVPYKDTVLKGDALLKKLDQWVEYGTIEPSCRDAIAYVATNPSVLDLSGQYFVLLGAGSAMGPLLMLLALGANVIAVDLDRVGIWNRLLKLAKDSCGTMTFPVSKDPTGLSDAQLAEIAGCNLFTHTPEIRNWLLSVHPGKPLTIGGYAYLDGALHVQVSLAMEIIMKGVAEGRKDVALAFLCSPTDVFVCDKEARDAMCDNFKNAPWWQKAINTFFGYAHLKQNALPLVGSDGGQEYALVDGLVVPQGPNYALAKRIQHWRAMIARSEGHVVSSNIAPSTATASVVSNKLFAMAYGGMHHFKPMEVMYQETSNAVMGALLIHDVSNKAGVSHPSTTLTSQLELFKSGAFHGGIWRMGHLMESLAYPAVISYVLQTYASLFLAGGTVAGAMVVYVTEYGLPFELP